MNTFKSLLKTSYNIESILSSSIFPIFLAHKSTILNPLDLASVECAQFSGHASKQESHVTVWSQRQQPIFLPQEK